VCAARQPCDDVTHSTETVDDVLHVQGVARLSVTATEISIAGPIWTLDPDDESVDVQQHVVENGWVGMVLYLERQLLVLCGLRQLDEAVNIRMKGAYQPDQFLLAYYCDC